MKSANTPKDHKGMSKHRGSKQPTEIMYEANEGEDGILEERSDGSQIDRRYDMSPVMTQTPVMSKPSATLLSKSNFNLEK